MLSAILCVTGIWYQEEGENVMTRKSKVSSKTHTKKQLDDYANQNNPNNKAYRLRKENDKLTKKVSRKQEAKRQARQFAKLEDECGVMHPLDWMCYSNPYDFD